MLKGLKARAERQTTTGPPASPQRPSMSIPANSPIVEPHDFLH
jgi:hypothetical protein